MEFVVLYSVAIIAVIISGLLFTFYYFKDSLEKRKKFILKLAFAKGESIESVNREVINTLKLTARAIESDINEPINMDIYGHEINPEKIGTAQLLIR